MNHLIQLEEKLDDSFEFTMLGPNVDKQGRNKWDRAGLKTPGSGKLPEKFITKTHYRDGKRPKNVKAPKRTRFKHKGGHMQVTTISGRRIVLPVPGLAPMSLPAQIKAAKHNAKR